MIDAQLTWIPNKFDELSNYIMDVSLHNTNRSLICRKAIFKWILSPKSLSIPFPGLLRAIAVRCPASMNHMFFAVDQISSNQTM